MLLGDLLAGFADEDCAGEALLAIGDLVLLNQVNSAAAERQITPGEFAAHSVGTFVAGASEEEWLTLIGLMSRTDNPGQVFLRRALAGALAGRAA